ncbi:MAG TPA: asparaginase [bacterium]|nr:asparaginase [bacterium]
MPGSVPLAAVERGGRVESVHRGAVAVADRFGRVRYAAGDPALPLYLRSACKPLQALPFVEGGGVETFGFTGAELAVICASHAAEPVHLDAVRSILSKIGLGPSALRCGPHMPFDPATAAALARAGRAPEAIHNNCSGKHAGMLASCRLYEWPTETYLEPAHPLQRRIAAIIGEFCANGDSLPQATDGCGVPTFYATVGGLAHAFARLADPGDLAAPRAVAVRRIGDAMAAHPVMVSGTGRLATSLMEVLGSRLFCKGGAEGGFGIALRSQGLGIAVKIDDGNARAMGPVLVDVLRQLGVAGPAEVAALAAHARPDVRNTRGQVVGAIRSLVHLEEVSLHGTSRQPAQGGSA